MSETLNYKSLFPYFASQRDPASQKNGDIDDFTNQATNLLESQSAAIYLDSAATCLTPKSVVDAVYHYQCFEHANSGRGFYQLSINATNKVEHARQKVAQFINAASANCIAFTASATQSIHFVALGYLLPLLESKSQSTHSKLNIVISRAEHHANFLPWQRLAQQFNIELRLVELDDTGAIDHAHLSQLVNAHTLLVAIAQISNVLGRENDIAHLARIVRSQSEAKLLVDGAQAVGHQAIDVQALDCDFYVFSAHKMYGMSGCGILYAKAQLIDTIEPVQLGGGIVDRVTASKTEYAKGLQKLESGSLNVAAIVGLSSAIDFIEHIGYAAIIAHQHALTAYLVEQLSLLPFIQPVLGQFYHSNAIVSFSMVGVHSHDVASMLDQQGIAVRAGQHCAQPLHATFKVKHSVRISLGLYSDQNDIDQLILGLNATHQLLVV